MSKAIAVIGACFGDESKGKFVDYFASRTKSFPESIVVRFCGGSQAGHTVQLPDGRKHVFHHFGSGTLLGTPTYLGPEFIVNPMIWQQERDELKGQGIIYCHPKAKITTPYDMLVNQERERQRGKDRRGSCGMGINETIKRYQNRREFFHFYLNDFFQESKVNDIRNEWVWKRLEVLGIETVSKQFRASVASEALKDAFMKSLREFQQEAIMWDGHARCFRHPIFEGSQGLLLDKEHEFYPNVTPSYTGLTNIVPMLRDWWNIEELEVVYVMRSYMTRHGNGPFPTEDPLMSFEDTTNQPNEWQGKLRFGRLDLPLIRKAIDKDVLNFRETMPSIKLEPVIAVSHCDQLIPHHYIESEIGLPIKYKSNGPTRENIQCLR